MVKASLLCVKDIVIQTSMYGVDVYKIIEGSVVTADITDQGISFLIDNIWRQPIEVRGAENHFRIIGGYQE